jgi:hypothetical protein
MTLSLVAAAAPARGLGLGLFTGRPTLYFHSLSPSRACTLQYSKHRTTLDRIVFFLACFKLDDYTHNRLILSDIPCTSLA